MKAGGDVRAVVVEHGPGGPTCVEVFCEDVMLGVWRSGYADVWAFSLADKDVVREAVRAEVERFRATHR